MFAIGTSNPSEDRGCQVLCHYCDANVWGRTRVSAVEAWNYLKPTPLTSAKLALADAYMAAENAVPYSLAEVNARLRLGEAKYALRSLLTPAKPSLPVEPETP